ncbi:FkbM family methyltransferase [Aeropyrum pernix]|nr:FkbM family methyltransferase [Aeropyrum pernix]
MTVRLFSEAVSRLPLYATLPCIMLGGRLNCIVAGLLNILLAVLSLKSPHLMKLYDSLCRKLAEKSRISFHGYVVKAVDCEGMVVFHPQYEFSITRVLLGFLKPGYVFIDVGAHQGRYTLLAVEKVGPKGLVIALEPVPETFQTLIENIRANKVTNIIALPLVAWSTSATLEFTVPPSRSVATAKKLSHFSGLPLEGRKIRVKAIDLDTLVLKILKVWKVDVVKIDAEGAEVEILEGLSRVLEMYKPSLIIEVRQQTKRKVLNLLKRLKYKVSYIEGNTLVALPP